MTSKICKDSFFYQKGGDKSEVIKAAWMDLKNRTFKLEGEDYVLDKDGEKSLINEWNAGSVACFLSDETRDSFKMSVEIKPQPIDSAILTAVLNDDSSSLPKWLTLADFIFTVEDTAYKSKDLKELVEQVGMDQVKDLGIQMKASVKNKEIDDETFESLLVLKRDNWKPVISPNFNF